MTVTTERKPRNTAIFAAALAATAGVVTIDHVVSGVPAPVASATPRALPAGGAPCAAIVPAARTDTGKRPPPPPPKPLPEGATEAPDLVVTRPAN